MTTTPIAPNPQPRRVHHTETAQSTPSTEKAAPKSQSLSIESAGSSPIPSSSNAWGQVALASPAQTSSVSNPSVFSPIKDAADKGIFDLLAIIKLLVKMDQKNYESSREMRQNEVNNQVSEMRKKAKSIKKEATTVMITAAVKGSMEIGSAGVKVAGGIKGANSLRGGAGDMGDMQARAASSQSIQMKWGAAGETMNTGGTFASASGDYTQKQEQAKETTADAMSQKSGANVSILSEDMQRFWSLMQSILSSLEDTVRANSEANKKSYY
ncbi:MAG: hypothetical protein GDA50_05225 [Alphaproteobacteria bacterium GM202ARS2]|nr:hypothetical protein [Alphaproteobacteria bacterium GM202ARS2]